MEENTSFEKRRIQGLVGESSFTVVLPKKYAMKLGISKGDYVTISEYEDALIIRKDGEDVSNAKRPQANNVLSTSGLPTYKPEQPTGHAQRPSDRKQYCHNTTLARRSGGS
jgi:bifunctional DNA-binding transcriptional regulator/antitoxin component of YhaV-PrlF toxin-antitoxin module